MQGSLIFICLFLDLFLKDPLRLPHPVQAIGVIISFLERMTLRFQFNYWVSGLISVLGLSLGIAWGINVLVNLKQFGWIFWLYFGYAGLALGSLLREGQKVLHALGQNDLTLARKQLGFLVSRETDSLNQTEVVKALIETLAENFNDGFVAPFFYLFLGGPAWLWVYKTVSTFDSMWGYKHAHYSQLGWAGAKLDDLLAFLPARLTAFIFYLGGRALGQKIELSKVAKQAREMASPNAGWPMAAMALFLEVELGGESTYFGKKVKKPKLGRAGVLPTVKDVERCLGLLYLSWGIIVNLSAIFWGITFLM